MDLFNLIGSDLIATSNGDLAVVDSTELTQQLILRRLITNPGTYIWHLNYGAGLPRYIGQPLSQALYQEIKGLIISQMFLEAGVAKSPTPDITLTADLTNLYCQIVYYDAVSKNPVTLSFTVMA